SFIRNGSPAWLDYGFYYASKSFYDPILKIQIIFGWIGEHGPAKGWSGAQSLPRAVEYD
ncbi:CWINV3, partial [Symbiodinium pilosum]